MRFLKILWKCIAIWKMKPATEEELRSADVIIAFSDSKMRDGSLGEGNKIIGQVALDLRNRYFLPVIAQEEANAAMLAVNFFRGNAEYVVRGTQDGKSHLSWNTAVIMDRVLKICRLEGWKKLIIATTPDHMPRCIWCAERRGLKAFAADMPKGQYFHKNLALPSCRSGSFRFRLRDFLVRIMFLLTGNI